MDEVRPLRDVFDRLVAREHGAAGGIGGSGHDDLDATLLADALVGYCDTVPVEVAEHLEHFVTAVTAHQAPDPAIGLDLLATAPAVGGDVLLTDTDPGDAVITEPAGPADVQPPADDLGFGTGTTEIVLPETSEVPDPDDISAAEAGVPAAAELPTDDLADTAADHGGEAWLDLAALDDTDADDRPEDDAPTGE
jgi:hypothetical protein